MFEYTHFNGKQLVQSVVKQEELKLLKTKDGAKEAMKVDTRLRTSNTYTKFPAHE